MTRFELPQNPHTYIAKIVPTVIFDFNLYKSYQKTIVKFRQHTFFCTTAYLPNEFVSILYTTISVTRGTTVQLSLANFSENDERQWCRLAKKLVGTETLN